MRSSAFWDECLQFGDDQRKYIRIGRLLKVSALFSAIYFILVEVIDFERDYNLVEKNVKC